MLSCGEQANQTWEDCDGASLYGGDAHAESPHALDDDEESPYAGDDASENRHASNDDAASLHDVACQVWSQG